MAKSIQKQVKNGKVFKVQNWGTLIFSMRTVGVGKKKKKVSRLDLWITLFLFFDLQ